MKKFRFLYIGDENCFIFVTIKLFTKTYCFQLLIPTVNLLIHFFNEGKLFLGIDRIVLLNTYGLEKNIQLKKSEQIEIVGTSELKPVLLKITVTTWKYDLEDSTGEDLKAVQMAFEYSKSLNFFLDVCWMAFLRV